MQIVELKVNVEKSQLSSLESQVNALNNRTINIKVNMTGLTALDNQTIKTINTLSKYESAQARVASAQAKSDAALAKQATAQARVQVAQEKTRQTATRLAIEQEKSARAVNNTATAYSKASKQVSGFQKLMGGSFTQIAAQMAMWQVMGTVISVPIRAMKDALNTMKEVDSQLVVIQKTTNFTNQQMKEIEKQAYKTASAYGQSADSYLESVAAFARAGYKEQSADLAELAIKTQLVGDTTAEVADQFLLSVDKAYKLNGSITELEKVLDGADYINNNYATSLEKIAEGMGIIAPVAEQAHVGVDELMAGIGTITAVTQRSGSEAARALRALFLNIIGDTKTEIEDGATWTAGEIEGLRDVLVRFAPDVVKAADAAKEVINPMEAMNALAKAMKEGVMTEQDLMEMVSDIGGKLRTSQLLALIQNWDMYESMLADYQTAAGTADKEISFILDSWESKANILKNTWTEFVSNMVETDAIKGVLDGLTTAIEVLDSDLGHAAISAAAFSLAALGIVKAFTGITKAIAASKLITAFTALQGPGLTLLGRLTGGISALAAALGPVGIAIAAIAATIATYKVVDFFHIDFKEQGEKVSALRKEYEELYGVEGEYQELISKRTEDGGLSAREQARLDYLETYRSELQHTINLEKELAAQKYSEEWGADSRQQDITTIGTLHERAESGAKIESKDVKMAREMQEAFAALSKEYKSGEKSQSEFKVGLEEILQTYEAFAEATKEGLDKGWLNYSDLTEAQKKVLELYDAIQKLKGLNGKDLDIKMVVDGFSKAAEFGQKSVINWSALRQELEQAGATAEDIAGVLAQLQSNDNVVLIDVEADGAEGTLEKLEELGLAVKEADGWHVDIAGLQDLENKLGLSSEEAILLMANLQSVDGITLENANQEIGKIYRSATDLISGNPYTLVVDAKDEATSPIQNIINKEKEIDRKITVTISGSTSLLEGAVSRAKTLIGQIAAAKVAARLAKGTTTWTGGTALLGDELSPDGAPRPELVIAKSGEAFIAGLSGPVAVNLPAGSRVFPYNDTREIFSGQDMTQVPAFPIGLNAGQQVRNVIWNAWNSRTTAPSSSGSSSSGSSRSGSSGSSRSRNRSGGGRSGGGSSGGGTASTTTLENLESELEILKQEYEFLEASNASTDELIAKSKEIQDKLHQINGELANSGGEQKDIINNSTEWWNELEKQRKVEQSKLSLLRKEYDFLEASGASQEELNKKSKEIQDKLHEINESLRQTNGSQEEILENSTAWWEELKKIQEVQISLHEDERDLLESELTLMEHQGKSVAERIAKMRSIQQNLHREAEYLRSIEASQAEINQLSIEWWEIQEKILDTQKDLVGELEAAVNAQLRAEQAKRDKEVKVWQDLIDAAKERRNLQEDQNELEEKNNRIIEARIALQNALNERTVRYYNAATGQWEWAADANSVKTAREELESATKDYAEAVDNQNFEKQAEIDKINAQYESTESFWQDFLATFDEPLNTIEEVLRDMYANGLLTNEQLELLKAAGFDIEEITRQILAAMPYSQYLEEVPNGDMLSYLSSQYGVSGTKISQGAVDYINQHPDASWSYVWDGLQYNSDGTVTEASPYAENGKVSIWYEKGAYSNSSSKSSGGGSGASSTIASITNNSNGGKTVTTPGGSSVTVDPNGNTTVTISIGGKTIATTTTTSGTSNNKGGSSNSNSSSSSSSNSSSSGTVSKTQSTVSKSTISKTKYTPTTNKKFDSGGVLSGLGGIKATPADEVVIPPEVASYMLKPTAPREFRERMAELGYLYGTNKDIPGTLTGILGSRTSNDHYGDVYQYGNITLTEGQARSMTVYDLAQMSRSLSIYRNV